MARVSKMPSYPTRNLTSVCFSHHPSRVVPHTTRVELISLMLRQRVWRAWSPEPRLGLTVEENSKVAGGGVAVCGLEPNSNAERGVAERRRAASGERKGLRKVGR